MRRATATYNAPSGDSKVVEIGGVTFFDGNPVDLNSDDHGYLIAKLPGNPHFDVAVGTDDGKKRGRPRKDAAQAGELNETESDEVKSDEQNAG